MRIIDYIKKPTLFIRFGKNHDLFDSFSDSLYLKLIFREKLGYSLDLQNPKTFNEKLQWLKINNRRPEYTTMVDKYLVKDFVAEQLGEEYVIPTLGVWNSFDEIDFDLLPNRFILKCTHNSGGTIVCQDKQNFNKVEAKSIIDACIKQDYYKHGREWPYKNVKPRVLAEPLLVNEDGSGLLDYKFYCFNGDPKFLYLSKGMEDEHTAQVSFLNLEWQLEPFHRTDYAELDSIPSRPENFSDMVRIAKQFSHYSPYLRVDLYSVNGQIYFSEFTFFPCSGLMNFSPVSYDKVVGEMLDLSGVKSLDGQ